ncbi:cytochrome c oxidase assembly protein [Bacillus tianshenii]|nr:cytochrome c oxidase assembly protein [Bacillus tianshenii]
MNRFVEIFSEHHLLELFGIEELIILIAIAILYSKQAAKLKHTQDLPFKRNLFFTGLFLYYLACGSPLHIMSEHLFSIKMVKASLAYFIVPPFLLAGLPAEMLRPILWNYRIKKIMKVLTNPVFSTTFFYGLFFVYLNPSIFLFLNSSWVLDAVSHLILFFFSIFMWWPVMTPLRELNPLSDMYRLVNLLINGCILFGIAYPLFLWDQPYAPFQNFNFPDIYTAKNDVIIGAATIMFVQKFLIVAIGGVILFKRFKKEDVIDPVNVSALMGVKGTNGQNS